MQVEPPLLISARHLLMLYIYTKFCEIIWNSGHDSYTENYKGE